MAGHGPTLPQWMTKGKPWRRESKLCFITRAGTGSARISQRSPMIQTTRLALRTRVPGTSRTFSRSTRRHRLTFSRRSPGNTLEGTPELGRRLLPVPPVPHLKASDHLLIRGFESLELAVGCDKQHVDDALSAWPYNQPVSLLDSLVGSPDEKGRQSLFAGQPARVPGASFFPQIAASFLELADDCIERLVELHAGVTVSPGATAARIKVANDGAAGDLAALHCPLRG